MKKGLWIGLVVLLMLGILGSCLPDTPETETRSLLDALREGAKKYAVSNCTLSVSLGCSVMKRGDILARCIERADDQMYLDKQARHRSGG